MAGGGDEERRAGLGSLQLAFNAPSPVHITIEPKGAARRRVGRWRCCRRRQRRRGRQWRSKVGPRDGSQSSQPCGTLSTTQCARFGAIKRHLGSSNEGDRHGGDDALRLFTATPSCTNNPEFAFTRHLTVNPHI
jgi:hypothetical protein